MAQFQYTEGAGDIDTVFAYIGKIVSSINERLEKKILLLNYDKNIHINNDVESISKLLDNNYLVLCTLDVREPASLGPNPFSIRKNRSLNGMTDELKNEDGSYKGTVHIKQFDNLITFYVIGNGDITTITSALYVQDLLDEIAKLVATNVAERMFSWEWVSSESTAMNTQGNKTLSNITNGGLDYIGLSYYVKTQRNHITMEDIIGDISITDTFIDGKY
jgi:hypothetical protein